jgi:hypothetical protein
MNGSGFPIKKMVTLFVISSGGSYLGCGFEGCLAQTGFVEGVYLCLAPFAQQITDNGQLGQMQHYFSITSFLCEWIRTS